METRLPAASLPGYDAAGCRVSLTSCRPNRVGEERLPSHTTKRAGFWHFAVSAARRHRSTCSWVLLLSASALTPCAHISALHFAAFCRQVSAVSRVTFPARRMRDRSLETTANSALRPSRATMASADFSAPLTASLLMPLAVTGGLRRPPGIRHCSFGRRDADLPPCYG